MINLETVIGLEIHLELNTKSKLFCSCFNESKSEKPNINICPICLGHPGVLPVLNQEAIKKVLSLGIALNAKPLEFYWFDRKNYFYPDLPKGYQISQYSLPIILGGFLKIEANNELKQINLERIHLEEDTARLLHPDAKNSSNKSDMNWSMVDFNRSGIPLLEIVTKPNIKTHLHAKIFLQEIQLIVRYLGISNADMELGQLRCDTNISLRPAGSKDLFPKTEIKNLNSFKAVEESLIYEIKRQKQKWENNKPPKIQTTRGWNDKLHITYEQRSKEEEKDYRYFPEPDLPSINLKPKKGKMVVPFNIYEIKKSLPELPIDKRKRFVKVYGFNKYDARILTGNMALSNFTEKVISEIRAWLISLEGVEGTEQEIWKKNKTRLVKLVANWLINRLLPLGNLASNRTKFSITPENFAEFIILVYEKKVSSTLAQNILEKMFEQKKDVDRIISEYKLTSIKDTDELNKIIKQVIEDNSDVVKKFLDGNQNIIQFLIGLVMKKTQGQSDPELVRKLLKKELI